MQSIRRTISLTRLFWLQERSDVRFALFNGVALPLALVYYGLRMHGRSGEELTLFMAGAVTMSVAMTAMSQVAVGLVTDRFTGRLSTLVYACRSRTSYFLARAVFVAAQGALVAGGTILVLDRIGTVSVGASQILLTLCVGALGSLAVGALGALIGMRARSAEAGEASLSIAAVALSLTSPVFYDVSHSATWVKAVAGLSPLTHLAAAFGALLRAEPIPMFALPSLAVIALVLSLRAYRKLEWG